MPSRRTLRIILATLSLLITVVSAGYASYDGISKNVSNGREKNTASVNKSLPLELISGNSYRVYKIVDGDTIELTDQNSKRFAKVRMIGVNTPETVDPRKTVQCFGKEASAYTHLLLEGATVRVEFDESQGVFDRYDRTLAYVWIDNGQEKSVLVNKSLIEDGYAYEYTYRTPYLYQKEFKQAQIDAQNHERGLWNPKNCVVI